jgi:hypothetical protein
VGVGIMGGAGGAGVPPTAHAPSPHVTTLATSGPSASASGKGKEKDVERGDDDKMDVDADESSGAKKDAPPQVNGRPNAPGAEATKDDTGKAVGASDTSSTVAKVSPVEPADDKMPVDAIPEQPDTASPAVQT